MTVISRTRAGLVARLMVHKRVQRVIVVDSKKFPVGIMTSLDLRDACPQ